MGGVLRCHQGGAAFPGAGCAGLAALRHGTGHSGSRHAGARAVRAAQAQRPGLFCPARADRHHLSPVAAIQRAGDGPGHHQRVDRGHLADLHRAAGLAGAQGKAERAAGARHWGGGAGRAAGGVARRPVYTGGRRGGDPRRLIGDDQRAQLGGVLDPFAARVEAAPGGAHDVLCDGVWLGLHHAAVPVQPAV